MAYFVFRPDENIIAAESRTHWKRQVEILESRVTYSKENLDRMQELYDLNPEGFDAAKKYDTAQEDLAEAKRQLKAARIKLVWEEAKTWARVPRPERGLAKYKKKLLKEIDWDKILKRDPTPEEE